MERTGLRPSSAPSKILGLFRRFARGRKGVVAIEFAMVAVPFLGLACAIFETAFVYFVNEAFDNAVNKVARQVLVNSISSSTATDMGTFRTNYFCPQLPSFITCANVSLNIQPAASFSAAASALGTSWIGSPPSNVNLGQPGGIVVLQAYYPMPVYLSVLVATGSNGRGVSNLYGHTSNTVYQSGSAFVHAIFSTMVFRNEPQ